MGFNGLRIGVAICAVAVLVGTASQAKANIAYILQNVTLAGGGTLTGSFTTNDARTALVSANITASANGSFPGFNYATPGSTPSFNSTFLRLDSPGFQVQLAFVAPLTTAGAALTTSGSSYESEQLQGAGNRLVTGGSVVAASLVAPEPSSLAQLLVGGLAGGLGIVVRSRRKKAA